MKSKEKRGLLILIIVSILIIGIVWIVTKGKSKDIEQEEMANYVEQQIDGSKLNKSEKINEKRQIDGIEIEEIKMTEKEGQTVLLADLTNTTNEEKQRFLVDIVLYDKEGKEIGRIPGVVGQMKPGETIQMQAGITEDYINAYDFKIEKK